MNTLGVFWATVNIADSALAVLVPSLAVTLTLAVVDPGSQMRSALNEVELLEPKNS